MWRDARGEVKGLHVGLRFVAVCVLALTNCVCVTLPEDAASGSRDEVKAALSLFCDSTRWQPDPECVH